MSVGGEMGYFVVPQTATGVTRVEHDFLHASLREGVTDFVVLKWSSFSSSGPR